MARVTYGAIEVNRCVRCDGLWFDMLEVEHLETIAGSQEIDIGDPAVGQSLDAIEHIKCPLCHTQMVRMVDARQPHIRYESCSACYGVFYDAGEFRDHKTETVIDFFRDLFAKERT